MDETKKKVLIDEFDSTGLFCDAETGICGPATPGNSIFEEIKIPAKPAVQKIEISYYTDPICSACWAIEPNLKKFELEYGDYFHMNLRLGGLLPDWETYKKHGLPISKPEDVAGHWEEVAQQTGMSIDGDIWLEDPLDSSYPPSVAYFAVQRLSPALTQPYMRRLREMVFLEKINIAKESNLLSAALELGLDEKSFLESYHDFQSRRFFQEHLDETRNRGVRGFPTFIFESNDEEKPALLLSGVQPYSVWVEALERFFPEAPVKQERQPSLENLFKRFGRLAERELSVMLNQPPQELQGKLSEGAEQGVFLESKYKYGSFWSLA